MHQWEKALWVILKKVPSGSSDSDMAMVVQDFVEGNSMLSYKYITGKNLGTALSNAQSFSNPKTYNILKKLKNINSIEYEPDSEPESGDQGDEEIPALESGNDDDDVDMSALESGNKRKRSRRAFSSQKSTATGGKKKTIRRDSISPTPKIKKETKTNNETKTKDETKTKEETKKYEKDGIKKEEEDAIKKEKTKRKKRSARKRKGDTRNSFRSAGTDRSVRGKGNVTLIRNLRKTNEEKVRNIENTSNQQAAALIAKMQSQKSKSDQQEKTADQYRETLLSYLDQEIEENKSNKQKIAQLNNSLGLAMGQLERSAGYIAEVDEHARKDKKYIENSAIALAFTMKGMDTRLEEQQNEIQMAKEKMAKLQSEHERSIDAYNQEAINKENEYNTSVAQFADEAARQIENSRKLAEKQQIESQRLIEKERSERQNLEKRIQRDKAFSEDRDDFRLKALEKAETKLRIADANIAAWISKVAELQAKNASVDKRLESMDDSAQINKFLEQIVESLNQQAEDRKEAAQYTTDSTNGTEHKQMDTSEDEEDDVNTVAPTTGMLGANFTGKTQKEIDDAEQDTVQLSFRHKFSNVYKDIEKLKIFRTSDYNKQDAENFAEFSFVYEGSGVGDRQTALGKNELHNLNIAEDLINGKSNYLTNRPDDMFFVEPGFNNGLLFPPTKLAPKRVPLKTNLRLDPFLITQNVRTNEKSKVVTEGNTHFETKDIPITIKVV